jgi:hypothetical protein
VPDTYETLTFNLAPGKAGLRKAKLHGREHYVVQTSMLAEGVWPGSAGPLFYPGDELAKSAPLWDHKPVVVYHPTKKDGSPALACDPVVLDKCGVGILLNTKYDGKLRTEVWIDVEKARQVDRRVLDDLDSGRQVECSTGLRLKKDDKPGEYNGAKYDSGTSAYVPDHLAALPDVVGAYSVKDGGGLLAVNVGGLPERSALVTKRTVENALARVGFALVGNEISADAITSQLRELLAAEYGEPGKYWDGWLCALYPEERYVVFSNSYRSADPKMRQYYTVKDDVVALDGAAEAVRQVVSYEVINEKGTGVANKFDAKAHVAALIGEGGYEEKDRKWLEGMGDAVENVKALPKKEMPAPVNNGQQPAALTAADVEALLTKHIANMTFDQVLSKADQGTRNSIEAIKRQAEQQKEAIINEMVALGEAVCPFKKEYLEKQDLEFLKSLQHYRNAGRPGERQAANGQGVYTNAYAALAGGPPTYNAAPPVPAQTLDIENVQFDNPLLPSKK